MKGNHVNWFWRKIWSQKIFIGEFLNATLQGGGVTEALF